KEEPVYNIEVDGDHCYRVGECGLLVHNASVQLQPFLTPSDSARTTDYVVPGANLRGMSPANSPLYQGRRNLGALYYRLGQNTMLIRLPASSLVIGTQPSSQHAERKLLDMLPTQGCPVVVEVYTERWPCPSCESVLDNQAQNSNSGVDIKVYFI